MTALKTKPEVQKYMKKLMSFVQFVRVSNADLSVDKFFVWTFNDFQGNVEKDGLSAMDTALAFDERKVLVENQRYLKKALAVTINHS